MKIELNIVNTIAWMKQTMHSSNIMNTAITMPSTDMPIITAMAFAATMKMMQINDTAMACPAIMLAKRRIIKAKGLVKIPTNSMTGIIGNAFRAKGTSGQKISFQ